MFSSIKSTQADEERKRHDLALEHLTQARDKWSKKRTKYLDYVNDKLRKEAHAKQTFTDIDSALQDAGHYNNEKTRLIGLKPKDAIKQKTVEQTPSAPQFKGQQRIISDNSTVPLKYPKIIKVDPGKEFMAGVNTWVKIMLQSRGEKLVIIEHKGL